VIVEGLRDKILRPVVGKTFKLAEVAKAHEAVMAAGSYGKIVLEL
jgi:NADPH:quinone reductase-like Zn-dependent oxidoreductase